MTLYSVLGTPKGEIQCEERSSDSFGLSNP